MSHSGRKNDLGSSYESTDQYEGMTHGMTHHNDSFTTMNQRRISLEQKARDRRIEIKPANQRPSSEKTIPDGYYAVSIDIIKIDYCKIRTCDVRLRFFRFVSWGGLFKDYPCNPPSANFCLLMMRSPLMSHNI